MKIKILEKCYTGTQGNMFKGDEHDIDDNIAEKLIARGFAEKAEAKKAKKLSNKSIKKLETPEDE
tara:strand:+ start:430 stop:624 length:195 start_codon:yes stop_codon:yes gene_type:complete